MENYVPLFLHWIEKSGFFQANNNSNIQEFKKCANILSYSIFFTHTHNKNKLIHYIYRALIKVLKIVLQKLNGSFKKKQNKKKNNTLKSSSQL